MIKVSSNFKSEKVDPKTNLEKMAVVVTKTAASAAVISLATDSFIAIDKSRACLKAMSDATKSNSTGFFKKAKDSVCSSFVILTKNANFNKKTIIHSLKNATIAAGIAAGISSVLYLFGKTVVDHINAKKNNKI